MHLAVEGQIYCALYGALRKCSTSVATRYYKKDGSSYTFELFDNLGLNVTLRYYLVNQQYHYHAITIRLNPKRLIKKDEYVEVARFNDYAEISQAFKKAFEPVREAFYALEHTQRFPFPFDDISKYNVCRIDYCANVRSDQAKLYMHLTRRADIPKGFKVEEQYDTVSKRMKEYPNTFYVKNKSVCINFYDKEYQVRTVLKNSNLLLAAQNVLRFEVQCNAQKVNNIAQKYRLERSIHHLSKDTLSLNILVDYYRKTVGFEDYYSLPVAKNLIREAEVKEKDKRKMYDVLALISMKRSVWKARDEYKHGNKEFNSVLKQIKKLGINPVTIPVGWKVKHLPNLIQEIVKEFTPIVDDLVI